MPTSGFQVRHNPLNGFRGIHIFLQSEVDLHLIYTKDVLPGAVVVVRHVGDRDGALVDRRAGIGDLLGLERRFY